MCRCRRASSRRAALGSTLGRGTVQTIGRRAPSHRMSTVPVAAAYRREFGGTPSAWPASQ